MYPPPIESGSKSRDSFMARVDTSSAVPKRSKRRANAIRLGKYFWNKALDNFPMPSIVKTPAVASSSAATRRTAIWPAPSARWARKQVRSSS
jgi:hypothetical protein